MSIRSHKKHLYMILYIFLQLLSFLETSRFVSLQGSLVEKCLIHVKFPVWYPFVNNFTHQDNRLNTPKFIVNNQQCDQSWNSSYNKVLNDTNIFDPLFRSSLFCLLLDKCLWGTNFITFLKIICWHEMTDSDWDSFGCHHLDRFIFSLTKRWE